MDDALALVDTIPAPVVLVAIGLLAAGFVLVRGLHMPANFKKREEERSNLKRQVLEDATRTGLEQKATDTAKDE